MEANAQAYDESSQSQIESGSQFIREVNLSQGDKVLDMGCGTGNLSKYIADIVGSDGDVVGIDPDAARITLAKEKYKEISSLQFHVGSSVAGFPHDNEPYYDAHISTSAFHWLSSDEKMIYIQKAHQCLKSGGKLGIFAVEMLFDGHDAYPLSLDNYQKLFQDVGLFTEDLHCKRVLTEARFKSLNELKIWFNASCYNNIIRPEYFSKGHIIKEDDGFIFKVPYVAMTASKK